MFNIPNTNTIVDKRSLPAERPSQIPFLRRVRPTVPNTEKEWIEVDGLDLRIRKDQSVKIFGKDGGVIAKVDGSATTNYVNAALTGEIRLEVSHG